MTDLMPVRRALPPPSRRASAILGDASRAGVGALARSIAADAARGLLRGSRLSAFPQYPLTRLQLSAEQATALFQLSGWCLLQRGEALKEALLESYSERIERAFEFGE